MRKYTSAGVCAACAAVGPVWRNDLVVLDFGGSLILEPDTILPELCDTCDYAQRRYDTWQYLREHPECRIPYPFAEPPPAVPPWRRPSPAG